jgi:hypothetical protein
MAEMPSIFLIGISLIGIRPVRLKEGSTGQTCSCGVAFLPAVSSLQIGV